MFAMTGLFSLSRAIAGGQGSEEVADRGRGGGKAGAPTSCLVSLADPAREGEDRHMVARNLPFSP